ncbi:hypothetical protein AtubIFM56815_005155 [Aspergillus tubingensis]|uniref:FAD/NAD(P)-binding domain-containing protein n=1 Tax=Aspergillus tubingensis TaxID=5068 RepID=A0A9W6AIK9_ASPTU|nr:hypothetical protein AtubIFM56815_005155 [Aspergillus tubingensis]
MTLNRAEHPIHAERTVRIACIGAGVAGLCLAYKLQRSFRNIELVVYEKNKSVGGVWYENHYPGVACDVPAHNYVYSFEPNPNFPAEYAPGSSVLQYLKDFATKYNLHQYVRTQTKVTSAVWNDAEGKWGIELEDLANQQSVTDTVDILINASGPLNRWKWPSIPGLNKFKGHLVHSANWDDGYDVSGKRIALIGNGSSGQQLLTALQPQASKLLHFIRQPNWIVGPFGGAQQTYTPDQITEWTNDPSHLLTKRKQIETVINSTFSTFLRDSPLHQGMRQYLTQTMEATLNQHNLPTSELLPTFAPGCRRPTPGVGYLSALSQPNTTLIVGDITRICADGLIDSTGTHHAVDAIICATGFDTTCIPSFPLIGKSNQSLADLWADDVLDSYFATTVPHMPNYAMFAGPFFPSISGSYLRTSEIQAEYICQLIDRYQTENIHAFSPSRTASRAFTAHCRKFLLEKTVWADACRSHYKADGDSARLSMWPGSSLHFADALRELRAEDYDWEYVGGDRFAWLGNGLSATGADETSDLAWYLGDRDSGPLGSRGARRRVLTKSGTFGVGEREKLLQGRPAD